MNSLDRIIKLARQEADNDSYNDNNDLGIPQNVLVSYANDAQDKLQVMIAAVYDEFNLTVYETNTVASQEEYEITDAMFLNNKLHIVELTPTGNAQDYRPLRKVSKFARSEYEGQPSKYIRQHNKILLNPIPNSATYKLRVQYERELDDLDIRRGIISGVTGDGTSGTPLTAITLDTSGNPTPHEDLADIQPGDFVCVCDITGTVQAYNIPVTAYDTGTGVLTVTDFVLGTDETLPAAGDYITLGKYTTTHSDLPRGFEHYIRKYVVWRMLEKDGSTEFSRRMENQLEKWGTKLAKTYGSLSKEIVLVEDLLGDGYGVL